MPPRTRKVTHPAPTSALPVETVPAMVEEAPTATRGRKKKVGVVPPVPPTEDADTTVASAPQPSEQDTDTPITVSTRPKRVGAKKKPIPEPEEAPTTTRKKGGGRKKKSDDTVNPSVDAPPTVPVAVAAPAVDPPVTSAPTASPAVVPAPVVPAPTTAPAAAAARNNGRPDTIRLMCIRRGGKLRIRFHSYTDHDGKTWTGVYNNTYNCKFPRNIREEGRFYEIRREDLSLSGGGNMTPFYTVKPTSIRILDANEVTGTMYQRPPPPPRPTYNHSSYGYGSSSSSYLPPLAPVPATPPSQIFEVNECVICLEGKPDQIFIPCAHLCCCSDCWTGLRTTKQACPLCRSKIATAMKHTGDREA